MTSLPSKASSKVVLTLSGLKTLKSINQVAYGWQLSQKTAVNPNREPQPTIRYKMYINRLLVSGYAARLRLITVRV